MNLEHIEHEYKIIESRWEQYKSKFLELDFAEIKDGCLVFSLLSYDFFVKRKLILSDFTPYLQLRFTTRSIDGQPHYFDLFLGRNSRFYLEDELCHKLSGTYIDYKDLQECKFFILTQLREYLLRASFFMKISEEQKHGQNH
ncbi:TPA: hypothetical protein RQJ95_001832 [Vibrio vulnificus]|nr:hypothetical protein [Vibrio vulnificus]